MRLVLENFSKSFDGQQLLNSISLTVEHGEVVALIGRSGCGKSTLLKSILGTDLKYDGEITIDGKISKGIHRRVGYVSQKPCLFPWLSAIDNVISVFPESTEESKHEARQLLKSVEIIQFDAYPVSISGGESQRVALACLLATDARLWLLDEPFGALDELTRLKMQRLLEDLQQKMAATTLLITHSIEEAVLLGDRIIVLENGCIALEERISLPRPRRGSDKEFLEKVTKIRRQVLGES